MGSLGQPLRPQRPARVHLPRAAPTRCSSPSPRLVSRELLTREEFQPGDDAQPARRRVDPVRGARLVQPRQDRAGGARGEIPLADDDPWPEHPMQIPRTRRATRAPTRAGRPRTSPTTRTGGTARRSTAATPRSPTRCARARTGSCRSTSRACRPQDAREAHRPHGRRRQLLGRPRAPALALHARAQRDLRPPARDSIRSWTDEELYDKARLINAALMAKIHTVDWTPAIIAHPTTVIALRANWWGLEGESLDKRFGRRTCERGDPRHPRLADRTTTACAVLADRGVRRRLPDAPADPGRLQLPLARRRRASSRSARSRSSARSHVRERLDEMPMADVFYSFGASHPGAIALHNYPRFLQHFNRPGRRRRSTWPRSTSCGPASAASRATTSSAASST